MSNRVVLFANGKVARLVGKNYIILIPESDDPMYSNYFNVDGIVNEFNVRETSDTNNTVIEYIYLTKDRFYKIDQELARTGFYQKSIFEDYRNSNSNTNSAVLVLLESEFTNAMFTSPEIGDIFERDKLEFEPDYTHYYKDYLYKFRIQDLSIDFSNSNWYPNIIDSNPNSPNYNVKIDKSVDLILSITGGFYESNFGLFVNELPENKKKPLSRAMTLICFSIYEINKDSILDKIAINDTHLIKNTTNASTLPEVDQIIWELLKNWGYVTGFDAQRIFSQITIETFETYFNGLVNLHKFFYLRDENKLFGYDAFNNPLDENGIPLTVLPHLREKIDNERRISYLMEVLPPATIALLSYGSKITYLERLMKKGSLNDEEQGSVLSIVLSFVETINSQEKEDFMDFLIEIENEPNTNFDLLFQKMNDKIYAYVLPIISQSDIFDPEESNKGNFCLGIYKIWGESKYNSEYVPGGTVPNEDGLNPNAYFLTTGEAYYNEDYPTVYYPETIEPDENGIMVTKIIKVDKNLDRLFLKITEIEMEFKIYGNLLEKQTPFPPQKLHLFQPISLINHIKDLDFEIVAPDGKNIPAFMLYYYEEFARLKRKYAQYSFAIDLTAEVIFFFLSGGTGMIKNLRYLKYVTKIGKAYKGLIPPLEEVYVWKGIQGTSESLSITSAVCTSYMNYLSATAPDSPQRELANEVGRMFLFITFLGGFGSIYSRIKVAHAADEVIKFGNLHPTVYDDLPTDVKNVVETISEDLVTAFNDFITIRLQGKTNILAKFQQWDDAIKRAFYDDFGNVNNQQLSALDDLGILENWKDLFDLKIMERVIIEFIIKQNRVNAIKRYYAVNEIRLILEPLEYNKRWNFLDEMGEISVPNFNRLINNSDLINHWLKYYGDLVLREEFKALGENRMIIFIEKYGNISEEAFTNIKYKPKDHIKHLMDFPDATHNIAYFNKRRAEMLPPPFKDVADGNLYGIQEIDSFIEVELQFGGAARPSLGSEAGDIVMQGGTLNGQSLDPMGLAPNSIAGWSQKYNKNLKDFKKAIDRHFKKIHTPSNNRPPLDKVVIDFKYMDEINPNLKQEIINYIETEFPQYNNVNYLIKLNL